MCLSNYIHETKDTLFKNVFKCLENLAQWLKAPDPGENLSSVLSLISSYLQAPIPPPLIDPKSSFISTGKLNHIFMPTHRHASVNIILKCIL